MKKIATLMAALMLMTAVFAGCSGTDNGSSSAAGESSTTSESSVAEESSVASETSETSEEASTTETGDYGEFTTIEEGKLIMSTNAQFPPYEMVADGEGFNGTGFEGIDVEIASAIADKLGLELQIDDMEFDSALLAVQNNTADVMLAGLSYSEERDEVVDFSTSYATGVQVVIVKGGYGEDHVQAYDNGATAVQALVNGQIDAVIIDQAPAEEFVAANEGLTILPGNWVEEKYCAAVDEGNTALLDAIDTALQELIDDGTVQEILDKYITAE